MNVVLTTIRKAAADRILAGGAGRVRALAAAAVAAAATGTVTYRLLRGN